jgi:hypothetical protein
MITFEDIIRLFLRAAEHTGITTHPDTWLNAETMEREFESICHLGPCEEADAKATCSLAINWSPLDTALALDGPHGVCAFFHEPNETCPHLNTEDVPPLALDLIYSVPLPNVPVTDANLQSLVRALRYRASESSSRAVKTQPSLGVIYGEQGMEVESVSLQQHVEVPLWNPERLGVFRELVNRQRNAGLHGRRRRGMEDDEDDPTGQEEWLPPLLEEVVADIERVLTALDDVTSNHLNP